MNFKAWAKKHWRIWYISYVFIYLPWFFLTEKLITADTPGLHIIHSPIDDMIPFCEYFIVPYCIWFVYIIVACCFMYLKGTDDEYRCFARSLITGMSACLLICLIYPNGVNMRPATLEHDNIFTKMVSLIWAADTSTNVFPSIHIYVSLAIHIALNKAAALKSHRAIRLLSLLTCAAICLSTLFLKQHSIIDVIGGFIMMALMYCIIYIPAGRKHSSPDKA